ncbi:hypothetical protein OF83DRAFT_1271398 [Amylostereum chailletii]|nr:hypothetical protein OF83DRAFT_1271398 [Amylostereum chailletii]
MSDAEDETMYQNRSSDPVQPEEEEEEEEEAEVQPTGKSKDKHRLREEEEEEEDEEDEEDDEDDEEDEDDGAVRGKKRQKVRRLRPAVNRFLDVEAEVDDDEEEYDDDEEADFGRDAFIAEPGVEGDEEEDARRSLHHARLDRRHRELDDRDLVAIANDISQRNKRSATHYTGDMSDIPQRLLMPDVKDANLWQVRCKIGRERDLVFSLMRKAIDYEYTNHPLQILSAFQRDSLIGMIYVEARSQKQVLDACQGLVGIYPSRGVTLVPIEEMSSLLQIKQQDLTVAPGSWVRIKRGKYQGDLAQVMDVTENGEEAGLKFIPRIDLNPKDEANPDGKKRKRMGIPSATGIRSPQRFFNFEEVVKVYGRKSVSKRNQVYVFQNDTFKDGFIEKDYKINALVLENVNPTLDEITRFARGQDGAEGENNVDLSIIAEASRKAAIAVLQPGDHVEVFEGEQAGVHGIVDSIAQDVVTLNPVGVDLEGQKVEVPARSVRKRFKAGDHVKVMAGKNADETGLVVSVADNVVTFLSDMSMQEVSVFSKDLREASEVGASTNIVGDYELHDLVQLDQQTVGVIYKTERDSFRVLDQNGQTRLVHPHQISMRRDSNRAIATDAEGHELRKNDNVKENDGEGRKGRVLHIHQSFFAFLHNRDVTENGGVFVTRARSLVSLAPKGNAMKPGTDLSKMNPAMNGGGMVGSGNIGRGPRDRLIGIFVTVVKGPNKGYNGTIKDTNGPIARVELNTGNKVITIDKEKLRRRNANGTLEPLEGAYSGMGPPMSGPGSPWSGKPKSGPNPYAQSNRTPAWGGSGRTPNPYADGSGKTPAWNGSSRTPNPYAQQDGGRTPAWNAGSKTPNPYASENAGSAWATSSRTPNPYASGGGGSSGGWGGATPNPNNAGWNSPKPPSNSAWGTSPAQGRDGGFGGATPGRPSANPTWGGATPGRWGGQWDEGGMSAPTPGGWGAPTPAATAPTPAAGGYGGFSAKTPAGIYAGWGESSAETPAVSASFEPINTSFELSKNWLGEDAFRAHRAGMRVRVLGTRGDVGFMEWDRGLMEGKEGIVLSVLNPDSGLTATANVRFGTKESPESRVVPIMYLVPVPPSRPHGQCVALDGKYKGAILKLREKGMGTWLVTVDESRFEDIPEDRLVSYEPL